MVAEEEEKPRKRKGIWTSKKILLLSFFVFAIIVGMLFQHFYVEPFFEKDFERCKSENVLLNKEIDSLYVQVHDLNALLRACEFTNK